MEFLCYGPIHSFTHSTLNIFELLHPKKFFLGQDKHRQQHRQGLFHLAAITVVEDLDKLKVMGHTNQSTMYYDNKEISWMMWERWDGMVKRGLSEELTRLLRA